MNVPGKSLGQLWNSQMRSNASPHYLLRVGMTQVTVGCTQTSSEFEGPPAFEHKDITHPLEIFTSVGTLC